MSIRTEKKYNIGLDIGTNSVGWAVTDDNDDVIKYKNHGQSKRMWGALLFEEGKTAKERRGFRSTRRRYNRRRERINILQHFFETEIMKTDQLFFRRLEESKLVETDRKYTELFGLFKSKEENAEYYKNFPTIYHLRNALCNESKKFDIRLVYLAIHHIIKYRGNFLYENQHFNVSNINIKDQLIDLFEEVNVQELTFINYESVDFNAIKEIILDKHLSKKQKQESIILKLNFDHARKDCVKNIVNLLMGLQGNLLKILSLDGVGVDEEKLVSKVNFTESTFTDNEEQILSILGDNAYILEKIKDVYTSIFLLNIFGEVENPSISSVMIKKYQKHHADLKILKDAVKEFDAANNTSNYDSFFRSDDEKDGEDYNTYIRHISKFSYENLKAKIKTMIVGTSKENMILKDLENDNFLTKINMVENALFPFQLNLDELVKIIENQSQYYPFLKEKVSIDNIEIYKLVRLLTFRIPYYVGPIVAPNVESSFAWFERKSNERITPFNFNDIVDFNKSAELFITKMTNFCTYLPGKKVLPKNSLLYSEFMVINEIKQIKINDEKISLDLFKRILNELFKQNSKPITDKEFRKWLIANNIINDDAIITGYQSETGFASSLKSYNDFKKIFQNIDDYETTKMVERIIEWITIYEDKKILKSRLKIEYPNIAAEEIDRILTLKYTGWAELSRELLSSTEIGYEQNDEYLTIIGLMRETKENFMQIINNKKYKIDEQIKKYNYSEQQEELSYSDVDALHCSPAVKKGIWQAILLTKEIINIMGGDCNKPQHVFLEFARNEDKKVRTSSRKKQIQVLYDKIKNISSEYNQNNRNVLKLLSNKEYEKVDSMRLFLYFMQQGKCLYSGEALNIEELNIYEVDHIIPRSLIKDDSFDNLALVKKEYNQRKSDGTINANIQRNQKNWWLYLMQHNFISNKKYKSLTTQIFSEEIISGFINRQLVETRQIVKNVANLLNSYFGDDCVCAIRANFSSNFREKQEKYKFRDINNIHHAHDAYLASVLGNYILKEYPNDMIYSRYNYRYDKLKENGNKFGIVLNNISNEKTKQICNYLSFNDPLVTRKSEIQTGKFYKQTLYSKKTPGRLIPINEKMDVSKYGGYTGENKSYLVLIEYSIKNKKLKKIISIPVRIKDYEQNKILEYLNSQGYNNPIILQDKIGKNQLINFKNQNFYMSSDSELVNAVEFHFNKEKQTKYNKLLNYILNGKIPYDDNHNELPYDINLIDELIYDILQIMQKNYCAYNNEYTKINNALNLIGISNLSETDKINLVKQLFVILKANTTNGNLKFLNNYQEQYKFDNRVGRQKDQNIISGEIIYTSLTGLKTHKVLIGE